MREKLYTKAPWTNSQPHAATIYIDSRLRGTTMQEVAACGPTETRTERKANANLISAAPELLEALENMSKQFAEEVADGEYCANYQEAQIAINKAYGETI